MAGKLTKRLQLICRITPELLYETDMRKWCAHTRDGWLCTRTEGHKGMHISMIPFKKFRIDNAWGEDDETLEG